MTNLFAGFIPAVYTFDDVHAYVTLAKMFTIKCEKTSRRTPTAVAPRGI